MYQISIPAGYIKKFTSVLTNKLSNTYNILSTGILVKSEDLEKVLDISEKLQLKITYKKVAQVTFFYYLQVLLIKTTTNMIVNESMRTVILSIIKSKIQSDSVSPNQVAQVAWDCGVELTSAQIVYISNNF